MPKYVTTRTESEIIVRGTTVSLSAAAGDNVFLSLRGWPDKAIIDRVTITANTDAITGPMDIKILSNPAAYRAAVAPADEDYVLAAWDNETGATGPNTTWKLDERYVDGIYVEDATRTGSLHFYLEAQDVGGTTLSGASTYDIKVYGRPSFDMENYFNRQHISNEVYWRNDETANTWTDLTTASKNTIDARHSKYAFNMVTDTTGNGQYFYVGANTKFTRVYFDVLTPNTTQQALVAEYWDGSAWQTLTIFDCTDAWPNTDEYTLSYSGLVHWVRPAGWVGCQLPLTNGSPPDAQAAFFESFPRYYVRFGLTSVATNPSFYSIRILPEILSNQR